MAQHQCVCLKPTIQLSSNFAFFPRDDPSNSYAYKHHTLLSESLICARGLVANAGGNRPSFRRVPTVGDKDLGCPETNHA